jgi:hypothetical protein
VLAAMLRQATGTKAKAPILVPPDLVYRGAIEKALPERMHGESTNGDLR